MNKKSFKSILLLLILITFLASPVFAATLVKTIKVTISSVMLKSNNKQIVVNSIKYNNTIYVPLNQVAALLNKKVSTNKSSIVLIDKDLPPSTAVGYSRTNPATLNTPLVIAFEHGLNKFKAKITIKEIVRGADAWNMLYKANEFNEPPTEGYEYILAKINFELLEADNDASYELSRVNFKLISEKGKEYPTVMWGVCPEPQFDNISLYKGSSHEGWVVFQVEKTDLKPTITFGRKYDGTGGIWFKAYK
ncbi:hypothetical protein ABG79_02190 [Caloramator mitchellensis]|uniref:DUF4352 domain-containing protein n=1 Tax=Caloramator mitchellensis TaxID=908809 RepID=A0A0R3JSU5_CALMK|nr:DUF4352 domain-containing protein [Caloramator mitchellensis]KRQ86058.1 hypothetical protein ABG79_02190 [Caloramator mitchellensis]